MLRVGLTGGIAAGKSTVARRLTALGAVVVDADALAREVVSAGSAGLSEVVAAFGADVLGSGGELDRPALARLVFADATARARLEQITHPRIAALAAERFAAAPPDAVVVHDVPLLVEKSLGDRYHLVVVVHAHPAERVRRLVDERGMTEADARARVEAQAGDEARRAAADVWLDNTGARAALLAAVDRLWRERLTAFEANVRERRGAPRRGTVEVVDPDPNWPAQAARLLSRVARALPDGTVSVDATEGTPGSLSHLGSTAVPGLPAKDVLDLQLVVPDLAAAQAVATPLAEAGFPPHGDEAWWDDTPRGREEKRVHLNADPGRPVNLHVRTAGSWAAEAHVLIRDYWRVHDGERDAYAALKRSLAGLPREEYLDRKGPWLRACFARAAAWASDHAGGQEGGHAGGHAGGQGRAGTRVEAPTSWGAGAAP